MTRSHVTQQTLMSFLARLDRAVGRPLRVYLIGETSQVAEGWRDWTTQIEVTVDRDRGAEELFATAIRGTAAEQGVVAHDESPEDVIPLPDGFRSRSRPVSLPPVSGIAHLECRHFDPYSVAFCCVARGDEPDYHVVMTYLEQGWVKIEEMDARLAALLPAFTRKTIEQDPAEFRRKYKGLLQMANKVAARSTHRSTPA